MGLFISDKERKCPFTRTEDRAYLYLRQMSIRKCFFWIGMALWTAVSFMSYFPNIVIQIMLAIGFFNLIADIVEARLIHHVNYGYILGYTPKSLERYTRKDQFFAKAFVALKRLGFSLVIWMTFIASPLNALFADTLFSFSTFSKGNIFYYIIGFLIVLILETKLIITSYYKYKDYKVLDYHYNVKPKSKYGALSDITQEDAYRLMQVNKYAAERKKAKKEAKKNPPKVLSEEEIMKQRLMQNQKDLEERIKKSAAIANLGQPKQTDPESFRRQQRKRF